MSRKRVAGFELLTGGTGDVNPQYIHGSVTLSAANTVTEVTLGTPIVRVGPQTGGNAIIMELLKLYVNMPSPDQEVAGATQRNFNFGIATVAFGTTLMQMDDPRVIAQVTRNLDNAFTAAGTGMLSNSTDPMVWDFTDGAGHGILVATDNIFVQGSSSAQAAADTFRFKLLYRFKKVSLIEYIGIVQSQQ